MEKKDTWTVMDILKWSEEYLTGKGVDNAKTVVEWLLCETLSCSRIDLYLQFDRPMSESELAFFRPMLLKCAAKQPVQQVVGACEFYGLTFTLNDKVLVPRPETERLVEEAIALAPELIRNREERAARSRDKEEPKAKEGSGEAKEEQSLTKPEDIRILDIGAGSGCIAVALAMHIPQSRLIALESSEDALQVLRRNINFYNLDNRIGVLHEDIRNYRPEERFDMIVSNPPYISGKEVKGLDKTVSHYEPYMALSDAEDGLAFYRRFSECFPEWLVKKGAALLEYGGNAQTPALKKIFSAFEQKVVKDYQQDDRVLVLRKK